MLYKLSIANIKKSFKDYAIYFITLILGVCIFYVFNSIDSQTAMLKVSNSQSNMINMLMEILSYVSIFVSLVLGFLIIYASRFMIKKRNKEFGIYMTLGMSKRKISFILLVETFIIGLISLAVGLLLGIFISQITSIFIANMFEANMTNYAFNLSTSAIIKTTIYFGIIYFIVMIFNTIVVSKNKLINLLQASKKGENIKIRNLTLCAIIFIISCLMLGSAYYMVTAGIEKLMEHDVKILLLPIGLGLVGTILFFYSVAGFFLKILSKCKKLYYKKLNIFTFKQISSKVNTMVFSISIICIMLFITLCMLSSAFSIKNFLNKSLTKNTPMDFQIVGEKEVDLMNLIESNNSLKNNTKDLFTFNYYWSEEFDFGDSLGSIKDEIHEKYPLYEFNLDVNILKESDYNYLSKKFDFESVNLKDGEYAIVSNYEVKLNSDIVNRYSDLIKRNETINVLGHDLKPVKLIEGFLVMDSSPYNIGFIVVQDDLIDETLYHKQILCGNYTTEENDKIIELDSKLFNLKKDDNIMIVTKKNIRDSSNGVSAIVTFIGLYLGIIFLISSSAILALKMLSDCLDDKNKYKILRQIGTDEKDINKSLFKQNLLFYMMPLSLAIVHTAFGLKFCFIILKEMGISNMLSGSIMTFVFLLFIYGIYFIITYLCSKNIIRDKA